jgi:hypothetical protein
MQFLLAWTTVSDYITIVCVLSFEGDSKFSEHSTNVPVKGGDSHERADRGAILGCAGMSPNSAKGDQVDKKDSTKHLTCLGMTEAYHRVIILAANVVIAVSYGTLTYQLYCCVRSSQVRSFLKLVVPPLLQKPNHSLSMYFLIS